jgi:hypothetical protein
MAANVYYIKYYWDFGLNRYSYTSSSVDNNMNDKMFQVNIDNNHHVVCPVFLITEVFELLKEYYLYHDKTELHTINFPAGISTGGFFGVRSTTSLFKKANSGDSILTKIRLKDLTYYCSKGLILDEHKNILMMSLCDFNFDYGKDKYWSFRDHTKFNKCIFRINRKVFCFNDPVSKILKSGKLLSDVAGIVNPFNRERLFGTYDSDISNISIEIGDFNDVVVTPELPTEVDGINNSINKLLVDNVDKILK